MQCVMRQRRCSTLENIDMEQQQQSLFDVSIIKLQHEQLRHGVEPRLLRFVLINNALRSLQGHMHVDEEDSLVGIGDDFQCDSGDVFFYNTFKNGSLSSVPLSPPSQVKVMKLDNGFNDQSPLIEYQEAATPSPSVSHDVLTASLVEDRVHPAACYDDIGSEGGEKSEPGSGGVEGGGGGGKDKRTQNGFSEVHGVHLGKRGRGEYRSLDLGVCNGGTSGGGGGGGENSGPDPKKPCKPSSLIINSTIQKVQNGLNGFLDLDPFPSLVFPSSPPSPSSLSISSPLPLTPHYHHSPHYSSADDSDKDSLTPSPIDFTNVDPSLYDFDTVTAVLQVETPDHHHVCPLSSHETTPLPSTVPSPMAVTSSHMTLSPSHVTASANHVTSSPSLVTLSKSHSSSVVVSSSNSSHVTVTPVTSSTSAYTMTTPLHSSPLPSPLCIPTSTAPIVDPPTSQYHETIANSDTTTPQPSIELEKMSLVSADSTVLTAVPAGGVASSAHGGSCAMEAIVRAQNGDLALGESNRLSHDRGGSLGGDGLASSSEHGVETDYMDEIDHIVNLLMT